jgi:predicted RNA-binding Zn-ribbon protein involved in translation (DUF1610 family)
MTKASRIVECAKCGAVLPEYRGTTPRLPCPKCGSILRHIELHIEETGEEDK